MYDMTGHSEYTQAAGGGAGDGAPFTTMRAEEIFRQFFGGDFGGLGSMFGGDFGMGNQQVCDDNDDGVILHNTGRKLLRVKNFAVFWPSTHSRAQPIFLIGNPLRICKSFHPCKFPAIMCTTWHAHPQEQTLW